MTRKSLPLLPLVLDDVPRGLRQALIQEGIPFRDRRPGPPEGRFVLHDSRTETRWALSSGQTAIDVDRLREGWDEDPLEMLFDCSSSRFRWEIDGLSVTEEIARVDKRDVRRKVLHRLRMRIEASGGIWLRVSPYPFPNRSAFNFRIDYDGYDPADFRATLRAIADHENATSHIASREQVGFGSYLRPVLDGEPTRAVHRKACGWEQVVNVQLPSGSKLSTACI